VTGRAEPIRIELRDAADAADLMRELEGAVPAELRATERRAYTLESVYEPRPNDSFVPS
jgi:hypothetical protein